MMSLREAAYFSAFLLIGELAAAANQFTVKLNNAANTAVLEDDGNPTNKLVQVRSTNGSFATIKFTMPTVKLIFDLQGGNDSLTIDGSLLNDSLPSVDILGRAGNDTIFIQRAMINGALTSTDTLGNNSLSMFQSSVTGNMTVSDGSGVQTLSIAGVKGIPLVPNPPSSRSVYGSLSVTSTDGGSNISLGTGIQESYAWFGGNVLVDNKGFGKDTIRLNGNVTGNLSLTCGNGDLEFTTLRSSVAGIFSWTKGSGITNANIFEFTAKEAFLTSFEGDATLFLLWSTIRQDLMISNGLGFDNITLTGVSNGSSTLDPLGVDIQNGDGGSRLTINNNFGLGAVATSRMGTVKLVNGEGADEVSVNLSTSVGTSQGYISDLTINNGPGNSVLSINGLIDRPIMDGVRLWNEAGFDTNTLTNAQIRSSVILYNNDGGSETNISNSKFGELNSVRGDILDLQSGTEADYINIVNSVLAAPSTISLGAGNDTLELSEAWFQSAFDADGGSDSDIYVEVIGNLFDAYYSATGFEQFFQF